MDLKECCKQDLPIICIKYCEINTFTPDMKKGTSSFNDQVQRINACLKKTSFKTFVKFRTDIKKCQNKVRGV